MISITGRRLSLALIPFVAAAAFTASGKAEAHHVYQSHPLQCNDAFPCPNELRPRVNFWINVFATYDSGHAIFHDPDQPERVYSVLKTNGGCARGGADASVERERRRIREQLRNIASALDQGGRNWSSDDLHYLEMFPGRRPAQLRAAAERVRCQGGNRDRFIAGLQRSGAYRDHILRELRQAGLPDDIQYLPFVESAFNPEAYSRVGAAGMWQIMPATGRQLGLQINAVVDQRMDPEAATLGAVRYLSEARRSLTRAALDKNPGASASDINPFVITSYNYGVNGMRRAINQLGPDYMRVINEYRGGAFGIAVRNFYSSFLAARHVATNAERYFGPVRYDPPLRYDRVTIQHPISVQRVSRVFGVPQDDLRRLNLELSRNVWQGWRALPAGHTLRLPHRAQGWATQIAELNRLAAEQPELLAGEYRVRGGDTACGIARNFGVACRDLIQANNLGRNALIRVGQTLIIPGSTTTGTTAVAATAAPSSVPPAPSVATSAPSAAPSGRYVVQRGDTACAVAGRHGVDCRALIAANGLNRNGLIRVGQTLTIPGGATTVASAPATASPQPTSAPRRAASYTVQRGDTACAIARRHGVACADLIAANSLNRAGLIRVGQTLTVPGAAGVPAATEVAYTVRPGDTVCQVAERHGAACADVVRANQIGRDGLIRVGQTLTVPGAAGAPAATEVAYTVRPGDTVCQVAERHGAACADVVRANRIGRDGLIRVGQELTVPGATQAVATARDASPTMYTVRAGDTACAIASRHGVSCRALTQSNNLGRDGFIRVGQVLQIPGSRWTLADSTQVAPPPSQYTVVRGDTACAIARRFSVACSELVAANNLGRNALIRVGQQLTIPGAGMVATATDQGVVSDVSDDQTVETEAVDGMAIESDVESMASGAVDEATTPEEVDDSVAVEEAQGITDMPAETPSAMSDPSSVIDSPTEETLDAASEVADVPGADALDAAIDLRLRERVTNGEMRYFIAVEHEETLGHYADWLGIGPSDPIRRLNNLTADQARSLRVGQELRLPISDEADVAAFEQQRAEYHRALVDEFRQYFVVDGVEEYVVRSGDNAWAVARRMELPLWVVTRFNPQLRTASPAIGDVLLVPVLRPRQ